MEIEDQPPIVEEIDEQVQDAANVAFQEGLLLEEEMAEEQWCLKDSVMSAFNTIFQGYKTINSGFMEMSRLIDATPLHAMGQILNDESAARSAGYGEGGVWKMTEKQRKLLRGWGGAERRVERELKVKRTITMTIPAKFQKENQHPKKGECRCTKGQHFTRSKEGKRKVKKVGLGDSGASLPNIIYWGKVLCLCL